VSVETYQPHPPYSFLMITFVLWYDVVWCGMARVRRLMNDSLFRSSYDYFFFTEGDQILLARKLPQIFSYLTAHPYTVREVKY
jgi:hypothetical protein